MKQNSRVYQSLLSTLRAIYTVRLCRMRQAYDRPTTRIVSCKSNLQLAYDCRVRLKKCRKILKADLDGTTFSYDCRMRFLERVLLTSCKKSHTTLSSFKIAYTHDCRMILKHILKSYDIFCVVHDSRKRVVGLIYTKQFVS